MLECQPVRDVLYLRNGGGEIEVEVVRLRGIVMSLRDLRGRRRFCCLALAPLGPHSRNMPRAPWWSWGRGLFLTGEVPL